MKHPQNKKERFDAGNRKGNNRGDNYFRGWGDLTKEFMEKMGHLRKDTTKLCSCPLCGNPRKYFKEKTIQEKKFDESIDNEILN